MQTTVFLLLFTSVTGVTIFREMFTNAPCGMDFFRCDNGRCVRRNYRCDKDQDCGDTSDERECSTSLTSMPLRFERIDLRKKAAEQWLLNQAKTDSQTERWGYYTSRIAVALYLTNETYFFPRNDTGRNMAFELAYQLSSRLSMRDIGDLPSTELASFINAFVASCIDPRSFQGVNLVEVLRGRVNIDEYVNPFVLIALCNAGDNITEADVTKLNLVFDSAQRELWTDIQALAVMALSCAYSKNQSLPINLKEKAVILKKMQKEDGIVDNIKTTSLILQALIASNEVDDVSDFNVSKAVLTLLSIQKSSGSFEYDILKTYFVLPVLSYGHLGNISSRHCTYPHQREEDTFRDWMLQSGVKHRIRYSLWLGSDRYLERTTELLVPANISFFKVMQVAAKLDDQYKFDYTMRENKPYVYSISKIEDDPENGKFWFLYLMKEENATLISNSPLDYIPVENEHLVLWYRKGPWSMVEPHLEHGGRGWWN